MFICSVAIWAIAVLPTQSILIFFRLRQLSKWRSAKSIIFYSVAFQNLALSLQSWLKDTAEAVLHLLHDYSKFLLYTTLFYYFATHAFHLVGNVKTSRVIIGSIAALNVIYLSGFTAFLVYDLATNEKHSSCKSRD